MVPAGLTITKASGEMSRNGRTLVEEMDSGADEAAADVCSDARASDIIARSLMCDSSCGAWANARRTWPGAVEESGLISTAFAREEPSQLQRMLMIVSACLFTQK